MQRATVIDGVVATAGISMAPLWWAGWIEGVGVALGVGLTLCVGIIRLRIALLDLRERRRQIAKRIKGRDPEPDVRIEDRD